MSNRNSSKPEAATPVDPFDNLDALRLPQDYAAAFGVDKVQTVVPVKRPDKTWFVRVHPGEHMRVAAALIELKEEREIYWVAPAIVPYARSLAPTIVSPRILLTAINRQNSVFLWPIKLPEEDGRLDDWSRSAAEAARMAETAWVRIAANRAIGAYDLFRAVADLPDPAWPEKSFPELLKVAFRDKLVQTEDHPVLQRLLGAS